MKLKLMNMAAMALSALLCLTAVSAQAARMVGWSASGLYDGSGSLVSSATAAYLVNYSQYSGTLVSDLSSSGYDAMAANFSTSYSDSILATGQFETDGAVGGGGMYFDGVEETSAYFVVFNDEKMYVSSTVSFDSDEFEFIFGDQSSTSASVYLASNGFQGAGWYSVANPEPAQPEWVRDGDEWDDATKTLTVNSNPESNAYSSKTDIENLVISDAVTSIGQSAFEFCSGLTSITIGNSVTSIGQSAFSDCSGLTSVTIPNSVTSIGDSAFYDCSSLTSVTIGNSVTSIGEYAFDSCSGLTSITIPSSVTSIGADAFYDCTSITDVYCYPNAANLTWSEDTEDDFIRNPAKATACHVHADQLSAYQEKFTGEVNVTFVGDLDAPTPVVPAWLREGDAWDDATKTLTVNSDLPGNAYANNTEIEQVIINNGVTSIGEAAFAECSGLTSVTIPEGVTSIGNAAFYLCSGMTSITIPNSVTSIGNLAFRYCSGLETVTINATTPPTLGTNAFQGTAEGLKIYVPAGSVDTYKTAWTDDADKIVAIPAPAPSGPHGECGAQGNNVVWSLNTATGVLTISGTGAMADFAYASAQPWYAYRSTITSVVVEAGVTTIGTSAFRGFTEMTSVSLPEGLTSIGESAFYADYNASFTTITFPSTLISIGAQAFNQSTGLTSITIPNSVTSIGMAAFAGCTGLTEILVSAENPNYCTENGVLFNKDKNTLIQCPGAKQGEYTIPNSVTSIGDWAFALCTGLTSITIPNSVTSIGSAAIAGCTALTSIEIPNSVTSIGEGAFSQSTGLTSITIPNSVTSIGDWAFQYCLGLESVTIGNSVEYIGGDAFYGCENITDVYCYPNAADLTWDEGDCDDFIESPAKATVCHVLANQLAAYQEKFTDEVNVTFVGDLPAPAPENSCGDGVIWELNDGVLTISYTGTGTGVMYDYDDESSYAPWAGSAESITSVIISDGVTSIGQMAFLYCTGLTSVTIPNSVTSIGMGAFGFTGLTSITIPNSVTSIGDYAFAYCPGLETVTINATTPPTLGSSAFEVTAEGLKIYVPAGSVDTYKTAWADYADKIEAITTVTYETWAAANGITGAWNETSGGIYNVFRYVFDKPTGVFPLITGIDVGESKVVITTTAVVNSNGVTVSVVESSDLAGKTVTATQALEDDEAEGRAEFTKSAETPRFYRLKAEASAAPAPAATVTTAPTAKTGVKAGQNEAIFNAGTADGGTMMYAVTTDNTQPASTDGFSATVPTAEGLTAGTYYVWYYVKADDDSHTDSEISATGIEVTIAAPAATVDLSTLTADYEAQDGEVLTGVLGGDYKITIADGATVTLKDVTITCLTTGADFAGITPLGDATILLEGANVVKGGVSGGYADYPGIFVPENTTLTIDGTGSLTASKGDDNGEGGGCGIGSGYNISCGNIVIKGGNVTAIGGDCAAGIGGGNSASCGAITITGGNITATGRNGGAGIGGGGFGGSCGDITITGGTVNATGGMYAAGIGSGDSGSCGTISITDGVTSVTATMGEDADYSIGAGKSGSCGTVTIGGTEGAITTSPYTYPEAN